MTTYSLHYLGIDGNEPSNVRTFKFEESTDEFCAFSEGYSMFDEEYPELDPADFIFQEMKNGLFDGWIIVDTGSQGDPELWMLLKSTD